MIDLTKPVKTRGGLPARIASTKIDGTFSVLAIIEMPDGDEIDQRYTANGRFMSFPGEHVMDLVNVPDTTEAVAYVNLGDSYSDKRAAQRAALNWPVVKLTLEVGKARGVEDLRNNLRNIISTEVVDA